MVIHIKFWFSWPKYDLIWSWLSWGIWSSHKQASEQNQAYKLQNMIISDWVWTFHPVYSSTLISLFPSQIAISCSSSFTFSSLLSSPFIAQSPLSVNIYHFRRNAGTLRLAQSFNQLKDYKCGGWNPQQGWQRCWNIAVSDRNKVRESNAWSKSRCGSKTTHRCTWCNNKHFIFYLPCVLLLASYSSPVFGVTASKSVNKMLKKGTKLETDAVCKFAPKWHKLQRLVQNKKRWKQAKEMKHTWY